MTRGTFAVGSGGLGFFAISPCTANDQRAIHFSSASFAGTTVAGTTLATTGVLSVPITGLPYAAADHYISSGTRPSVQSRLVSVGVRIQYTGTLLNRGGIMRSFSDPGHNCVWGYQALGGETEANFHTIDGRSYDWALSAIDPTEWDYSDGTTTLECTYPFSNGMALNTTDSAVGGSPLLVLVDGTAGNTFRYEVVVHVEYIGLKTTSFLTPTHADSVGFEKVAAAAANVNTMAAAHPETPFKTLFSQALQSVTSAMRPVGDAAMSGLAKGFMSYMNSGPLAPRLM